MERKYEWDKELCIGGVGGGIGYPFLGTLDNVMIFNRPLQAAEIKLMFEESK